MKETPGGCFSWSVRLVRLGTWLCIETKGTIYPDYNTTATNVMSIPNVAVAVVSLSQRV